MQLTKITRPHMTVYCESSDKAVHDFFDDKIGVSRFQTCVRVSSAKDYCINYRVGDFIIFIITGLSIS